MRTVPKGAITAYTTTLLPLTRLAKRGGFDSVFDRGAIATVRGYQKYVSPYKGFHCAHRMLYKGDSCSQYFQHIIVEEGLVSAIPLLHKRLEACKVANSILKSKAKGRKKDQKKQRGDSCSDLAYCDCDLGNDGGDCMPDCDCGDCTPDCSCGGCDF